MNAYKLTAVFRRDGVWVEVVRAVVKTLTTHQNSESKARGSFNQDVTVLFRLYLL